MPAIEWNAGTRTVRSDHHTGRNLSPARLTTRERPKLKQMCPEMCPEMCRQVRDPQVRPPGAARWGRDALAQSGCEREHNACSGMAMQRRWCDHGSSASPSRPFLRSLRPPGAAGRRGGAARCRSRQGREAGWEDE
jgi:hypothetical protein